ncbi:LysR family transcriptional regulator [Microbulbifer sp. TRSA007]|uniref:LysR family transcriptional regulator n=1 Tax=Microbulbifer sp. TRSA007 TaxID=3243384 RepID=UPI00403965AA
MDKWTELRTAYKLAKLGTLSATAQEIGIHRSTVMRHINVLEESLGVVLFQRNDKGYIPTEAGLEVMRLGAVTDSHFSQLSSRLQSKEQNLQGNLTITSVGEMVDLLMPLIRQYQTQHPGMLVNLIGDLRNFNLEYGEADIAIRVGEKPTTPDNIVLPFFTTEFVFYAHKSYIEDYGLPDKSNLQGHRFLVLGDRPLHFDWNEWIYNHIPDQNIVLTASSQQILNQAMLSGCGIGAMPRILAKKFEDIIEIPTPESWQISTWILVHRDMFNMPKIREFLSILKLWRK